MALAYNKVHYLLFSRIHQLPCSSICWISQRTTWVFYRSKCSGMPSASYIHTVTCFWVLVIIFIYLFMQFTRSGHTQLQGNAIMITSTISVVLFSTVVSPDAYVLPAWKWILYVAHIVAYLLFIPLPEWLGFIWWKISISIFSVFSALILSLIVGNWHEPSCFLLCGSCSVIL